MLLGLREVAGLFGVPGKTLEKWIREGSLPAIKVGGQYRFNRTEILEWATKRQIPVSSAMFSGNEAASPDNAAGLRAALVAGGIRFGVTGDGCDSVLENALALMPIPESVDRLFLLNILKAREAQGSTGIGEGIAIPHVRNPIVLDIPEPMITLCFLEKAVEFGAIDGKPVHTLFMMMSPTIGMHLNLLSRLAFALRQPRFSQAVKDRLSGDGILNRAGEVDAMLLSRVAGGS
jgi:PTS system nitrogen regulatory IIA component